MLEKQPENPLDFCLEQRLELSSTCRYDFLLEPKEKGILFSTPLDTLRELKL